jgi:hypothetical protein
MVLGRCPLSRQDSSRVPHAKPGEHVRYLQTYGVIGSYKQRRGGLDEAKIGMWRIESCPARSQRLSDPFVRLEDLVKIDLFVVHQCDA